MTRKKYEKLLLLCAYMELTADLIDEVGYSFPILAKNSIKQKGNNFKDSIGVIIKTLLATDQKGHEKLKDIKGNEFSTVDEVQAQFWNVVNSIEKANKDIIEETLNS